MLDGISVSECFDLCLHTQQGTYIVCMSRAVPNAYWKVNADLAGSRLAGEYWLLDMSSSVHIGSVSSSKMSSHLSFSQDSTLRVVHNMAVNCTCATTWRETGQNTSCGIDGKL